MASRFSAARPKRAGEDFARTHHNNVESNGKKVKFDLRNPSILAPDARDDDAVLDADVIGGGSATKRGAVNLDGYDSDSENETFNVKAASRKKGDVDILEQLDNYDSRGRGGAGKETKPSAANDDDDDDDDDMFAADNDEKEKANNEAGSGDFDESGRKRKDVHYLESSKIEGEEDASRSGGHVRLDERESSDDDADVELAIQEEGLDAEVGAGGLKRNAPKVEAFNLREEMEQGRFDQAGNYVRKAGDPDAVHDKWLEGLSKKDMRGAAEAHEKRAAEARRQRIEEDGVLVSDLLEKLIVRLEKAETPLEALVRLGKKHAKPKKVAKWKLKRMNKGAESMDADTEVAEDPAQAQIKEAIHDITEAADKLLSRDHEDVYDQEREVLIRAYRRETGQDWVEPKPEPEPEPEQQQVDKEGAETAGAGKTWEFRWTDGRDGGATQGPFDSATMKAWQDAGYFGQGVEFRSAAGGDDWTQTATFA